MRFTDLKPYAKAIVTFIVGAIQIGALYYTLNNDGLSVDDVNALANAVVFWLTGTGLVYAIPNTKK